MPTLRGSGRQRLEDGADDDEEDEDETEDDEDHAAKKSKVNDSAASASFLNSHTPITSTSSSSSSTSSADTPNPILTLRMGSVPEAYWMQHRQSDLEAKYNNTLTVMDTFDSYNVVELIELLSCMRGMTIKSITQQVKTSEPQYHKRLVEGKVVAMTTRTIYLIYSGLMISTFATKPAVPAGYSVPTVNDINILHSHTEHLVRSFTLLVETEEAKKSMTSFFFCVDVEYLIECWVRKPYMVTCTGCVEAGEHAHC